MESRIPTPITRRSNSRNFCTSGVKSLSPVQITMVVTKDRSKANSSASTTILMSAAFLRLVPMRCGISMSSTWWRARCRRSSSKPDQSA